MRGRARLTVISGGAPEPAPRDRVDVEVADGEVMLAPFTTDQVRASDSLRRLAAIKVNVLD